MDWFIIDYEARELRGMADDPCSAPAARAKIAHPGISIRLAELLRCRFHEQWMMKERRRRSTPKQARKLELTPRRVEQIFTANHDRDILPPVIHHDRELIRPVPVPVSREQISALLRRCLLL